MTRRQSSPRGGYEFNDNGRFDFFVLLGWFLFFFQLFFFGAAVRDGTLPLWMDPYLALWTLLTPFALPVGAEVIAWVFNR